MTSELLVQRRDDVGVMTLNRPEKRNALSPDLIEALIAATLDFERDAGVRAVLIRAAGDAFMAGGDIAGFRDSLRDDPEGYQAGMERRCVVGHLMIHRLRRMPKPVVIAVQGAAVGYGLGMACAADYVLAADNATFALAHRHLGLTSDGGVSYFLPRIVGERRALEIALFGERFDAQQACRWTLVNRVVAAEALDEEAFATATRLAAGPTRALGGLKRLMRTSLDTGWDQQSAREAEMIAEMVGTADHREGVTAFFDKRAPQFRGR